MKRARRCTAAAFVTLAMLSGCAAYRTSSNIPAEETPAPASASATVLISEDALAGRKYEELGPVEVSVKKLTLFHKDPTREQANEALQARARALGADAVINVKYENGIGLTTWGYVDAKGTAVKLTE